jgi:glyoxylase-like metal-dependent hydrolase (beta-lactamase superfamily II)
LANAVKPDFWSIIDDPEAANASVEKIRNPELKTIYPGHGQPFPMRQFLNDRKAATSTDTIPTAL